MATRFARQANLQPTWLLMTGVTRTEGRGIPAVVLQEEQKNRKEQMKARNIVKAAVLRKTCPDLVAVSVYDTKPVHFLSMLTESIV